MKTSKGLIGFLSGLFSILHILMMASAVFVFIAIIITFVTKGKDSGYSEEYTIISKGNTLIDTTVSDTNTREELKIKDGTIDVSTLFSKEYKLSYSLCGETKTKGIHVDKLEEIKIVDTSLRGKIINSINLILLYIIGFKSIKELSNIFNSLDCSIKNKIWFQIDNYHSLKKLAYLLSAIFITQAGLSTIYYFLLDDVIVNGVQVFLIPNLPIISTAWTVTILLIIAHVYKEGIQLREDQDLTI